jgi:hypothetical protein
MDLEKTCENDSKRVQERRETQQQQWRTGVNDFIVMLARKVDMHTYGRSDSWVTSTTFRDMDTKEYSSEVQSSEVQYLVRTKRMRECRIGARAVTLMLITHPNALLCMVATAQ